MTKLTDEQKVALAALLADDEPDLDAGDVVEIAAAVADAIVEAGADDQAAAVVVADPVELTEARIAEDAAWQAGQLERIEAEAAAEVAVIEATAAADVAVIEALEAAVDAVDDAATGDEPAVDELGAPSLDNPEGGIVDVLDEPDTAPSEGHWWFKKRWGSK